MIFAGPVLAFFLLVAIWVGGRAEFLTTKVVLTVVYLATWLLEFEDFLVVVAAQTLLVIPYWFILFKLGRRW
jgi:hypothetical protein